MYIKLLKCDDRVHLLIITSQQMTKTENNVVRRIRTTTMRIDLGSTSIIYAVFYINNHCCGGYTYTLYYYYIIRIPRTSLAVYGNRREFSCDSREEFQITQMYNKIME